MIQDPASYFVDTNKQILHSIGSRKRPKIVNTILKEKNKFGGLTLPDLKTYYKVTIIKTMYITGQKKKIIDR